MRAPSPVADPAVLKACCADLWSHPGVRLLAGPALRPGGLELTRSALSHVPLTVEARVLDVGCGPGATLRELRERGADAVGTDLSHALAAEAGEEGAAVVADAEALPFPDGTFAGAVMECVLSALPDKETAVASLARVLEPGGWLLMSDVVAEAPLPPLLDSFAAWIACAAGALSSLEYHVLLEGAGLRVEVYEPHDEALASMLAQVRRRLALVQGSLRAGVLDRSGGDLPVELIDLGQEMVAQAMGAVESGALGYSVFVGRRE
jgi:arsenite methyltransferase